MSKRTWQPAVLLTLIPAIAIAAWPQDPHAHRPAIPANPAWSESAAAMDKMHAAMSRVEPSGDRDVDFVELMLPHHEAAIAMAKTQLAYGKDPQMRRLAQEIITDQQSEIALMHLWRKEHRSSPGK
ncbi:MAG TPA: DUF305 domain-containing protein [Candidatus Saccharimonadales bacterium]|nr:DUF305 domain-containing protein [Candidatus Saccharimonadales bacterium]